jgi:hypothetical protein
MDARKLPFARARKHFLHVLEVAIAEGVERGLARLAATVATT